MGLQLQVVEVPESELEFGDKATYCDPKTGLVQDGPFSLRYQGGQPGSVRLGLVGTSDMIAKGIQWFDRSQQPILSQKENRRRFPDFPGFRDVFRTPLELADRWIAELSQLEVAKVLARPGGERFAAMVDLFTDGVATLARREMGPNVVLCSLSEDILKACGKLVREERPHFRRLSGMVGTQLALALGEDEMVLEEQLVYRTFRRALKARVMIQRDRLPIQIAHNHLFEDGPNRDDPATRAWSVSVGLFYKAGGIPWRLAHMPAHVCFVGLSFHLLRTTNREAVYASIAEAFSTDIEGFVLRGERIPRQLDLDPHLNAEQSEELGEGILAEYRGRAGRLPVRLTLHKTTQFTSEEREGFGEAFKEVPIVELLTLQPSGFRLVSPGEYPPRRGTLCTINGQNHFLYTTGFNSYWGTYPGPHVPEPLRIVLDRDEDLRRVSEDTLGLTKMNFNSASLGGRDPITLHMAREVGPIMAEVPENEKPEMSYRYYM